MKYLFVLVLALVASPAFGQGSLMERVAALEASNATVLQRLKAIETKIDALKVPETPPVAPAYLLQDTSSACGASGCSTGESQSYSRGPVRRILGRRRGG